MCTAGTDDVPLGCHWLIYQIMLWVLWSATINNFSSVKKNNFTFWEPGTCPAAAENAPDDLLLKMNFKFFKVQWLHFIGEVDKSVTFWCEVIVRIPHTTNYWNWFIFDWIIQVIIERHFWTSVDKMLHGQQRVVYQVNQRGRCTSVTEC